MSDNTNRKFENQNKKIKLHLYFAIANYVFNDKFDLRKKKINQKSLLGLNKHNSFIIAKKRRKLDTTNQVNH